jgi:hypothetical protein
VNQAAGEEAVAADAAIMSKIAAVLLLCIQLVREVHCYGHVNLQAVGAVG